MRPSQARRRRYAFVGTGHRAELYFGALLGPHAQDGEPAALCDVNRTRMAYYQRRRQEAVPGAAPLPEYEADRFGALLAEQRPDAVVVTTPDATHHRYIAAALRAGCHVLTEKPLTTSVEGCAAVLDALRAAGGPGVTVTFNYRYSPRNSAVRELLAGGAIGAVTSVHFEWLLDTVHGADYFRRWHRDKATSGGLLVHKAGHHFDLVNWWLGGVPATVYAQGALRFYGAGNARARGMAPRPPRSHGAAGLAGDPFGLDLEAEPRLRALYLDAEHEDGYLRDRDVFGEGITIEDNMAVLVRYRDGALLTYSLNAHAPWEGYRVGFNGTEGRLELEVCERAWLPAAGAHQVVGWRRPVVDPSAAAQPGEAGDEGVRRPGARLVVQRHWEPAQQVPIAEGAGGHGGGDALLLRDLFRGDGDDPLGRRAGVLDGVRSVLVGVAANRSMASGQPVDLADLGVPLTDQE